MIKIIYKDKIIKIINISNVKFKRMRLGIYLSKSTVYFFPSRGISEHYKNRQNLNQMIMIMMRK